MLGPVSESVFGEQDLLALNLHAIDRFPAFNAELEAASGQPTGLRTEGTLAVAYDSGDLAALDRLTEFRHSIGLTAERLDAQGVPPARAVPGPVHPGRRPRHRRPVGRQPPLPGRPAAAAAGAGVRTVVGQVTEVAPACVRFRARRCCRREARRLSCPPRASSSPPAGAPAASTGVPDQIRKAIRPVKGQILRLRHPRQPAAHHQPHRPRDRPGPRHLPGARAPTASSSSAPPRRSATTATSPPAPSMTCSATR